MYDGIAEASTFQVQDLHYGASKYTLYSPVGTLTTTKHR